MTPIINPWSIYLINVLAGICDFLSILGIISGAALLILALICFGESPLTDDEAKKFKKAFIIIGSIFVATLFLVAFIPDKETMYTMFLLNYVTPDNINLGVEGLKSMFDYIIEAVSKLMGG